MGKARNVGKVAAFMAEYKSRARLPLGGLIDTAVKLKPTDFIGLFFIAGASCVTAALVHFAPGAAKQAARTTSQLLSGAGKTQARSEGAEAKLESECVADDHHDYAAASERVEAKADAILQALAELKATLEPAGGSGGAIRSAAAGEHGAACV